MLFEMRILAAESRLFALPQIVEGIEV